MNAATAAAVGVLVGAAIAIIGLAGPLRGDSFRVHTAEALAVLTPTDTVCDHCAAADLAGELHDCGTHRVCEDCLFDTTCPDCRSLGRALAFDRAEQAATDLYRQEGWS